MAHLIEFSVWSNLDKYLNLELVLLKGHLMLEVILEDKLSSLSSLDTKAIQNLSFFKKLCLLELKVKKEGDCQKASIQFAKELNAIRNRLAHELFFEDCAAELSNWSSRVLLILPSTKMQRYTARTSLTQAIAAVAKAI